MTVNDMSIDKMFVDKMTWKGFCIQNDPRQNIC